MDRQFAINEIYLELRNGGVEALRAAALLYALGVSLDEVNVAMRHYGDG